MNEIAPPTDGEINAWANSILIQFAKMRVPRMDFALPFGWHQQMIPMPESLNVIEIILIWRDDVKSVAQKVKVALGMDSGPIVYSPTYKDIFFNAVLELRRLLDESFSLPEYPSEEYQEALPELAQSAIEKHQAWRNKVWGVVHTLRDKISQHPETARMQGVYDTGSRIVCGDGDISYYDDRIEITNSFYVENVISFAGDKE